MEKTQFFHFQVFKSCLSCMFRLIFLHPSTSKLVPSLWCLLLLTVACLSPALFHILNYILTVYRIRQIVNAE